MTNVNQQTCPQCRHLNSDDALICALCDWALVKEGMTLTCSPSFSNSIGNLEQTIAPAHLLSGEDTLLLDATIPPEHSAKNNKNAPIQNDPMAHFKINQVLGQGGMGAVYRAEDLTLHRFVALKLFRSQLASTTGNGQQLLDEARLACKLNHPNIVTIYDIARGQDNNFIVMEWVDGLSLDKIIPKNGLAVELVMEYACQIIDGLVCAHQNGIIHRDIKPQNIMLNKENRIKILDFGIADLLRQPSHSKLEKNSPTDSLINSGLSSVDEQNQTRISGLVGTPSYMAPEQAFGKTLDQRADIFSFGIVFYEMLTGRRPFVGKDINQLKEAFTKGTYPSLSLLVPGLPVTVVTLIDKMLAIDISKRWQTSEELAEEIHRIFDQLTQRKNWWQRRHWLNKTAMVLPLVFVLVWSVKEVVFPPTTQQLIQAQLLEAKKIAILPLDNISGDPVLQIFSDGVATMLSSDLAEVGYQQGDGTTWVLPSSEIRSMKEPTIENIYNKYGVDLILTGSIQHMGSTRSVNLSLVNGADGRQLKSVQMSIDAERLFEAQTQIRQQVMELLGWQLPQALVSQFAAQKPAFDGAYKYYLEGQGYLYRFDQAGNTDRAIESFEKAIEIDPGYGDAYVGLAEVQLRNFVDSKDGVWLDKMEQTTKNLQEAVPTQSLIDYLLGELSLKRGHYNQAKELLESTIKLRPNYAAAVNALSKSYIKLDRSDEAESTLLLAHRRLPQNNILLTQLGVFYFGQGDYDKAIKAFEKLAEQAPNNHWAYTNLSAGHYLNGDIGMAIKSAKISLALSPNAAGYSNLGTYHFMLHQYNDAVEAYEKMIGLNDKDYIKWGNLADAYRFAGDGRYKKSFQKAIDFAKQALIINPNDSKPIASLAYYLANLKEQVSAVNYAQQIGEFNSGRDNFIVATAYARLEMTSKTISHLKIAIDKNYSKSEIQASQLLDNIKNEPEFLQLVESYTN